MKFFFPLLLFTTLSFAEPLLDSWFLEGSRSYARIHQYESDVTNGTSYTDWTHPNSGSDQTEQTYAGVHEVSYDNDFVYVRSTGLGSHLMGPWWRNRNNSTADSDIFANWPGSYAYILSIPKLSFPNDPTPPSTRTLTGGGAIGMFVDGVAMFDSRDAFSYDSGAGEDSTPANGLAGSGWWERDAYVNESQTFDAANAHQAGETYHYHANPPGLRYQLGDSVTYDTPNNLYSEVIGGNGNHSPILGWARDGLPIYGPYGYSNALNPNSAVTRMVSGFQIRPALATNGTSRNVYPAWSIRAKGALPSGEEGPSISNDFPRCQYLQDYEYLGDLGQV